MNEKKHIIEISGIALLIIVFLGLQSLINLREALIIESETYKMELSKKGSVLSLRHIPTGTLLIKGTAKAPSYEIGESGYVTGGYGKIDLDIAAKKGVLENNLSGQVSYENIYNSSEKGYRFISQHNSKILTTEVVMVKSHGGIEFRMKIKNNSGKAMGAVRFPYLIAPNKLGENSAEDVILIPALDGGLVANPQVRLKEWPIALSPYPGNACSQLTAYYNKTAAGLYIACHDSNGNGKAIVAMPLGISSFDFTVWHFRPEDVVPDMDLNYPVVVDVFTGDWVQAAEKYRNWSLKQDWSKERLYNSKKVPEYIKKGLIWYGFWQYAENSWNETAEANPKGSAAKIKNNNTIFGMQQMVFQQDWAQYGGWIGMDFFPPKRGMAEFELVARRIREQGAVPMIYLSGFKHTIKGTGFNNTEFFWKEMAPYALRLSNGKIMNAPAIETPGNYTLPINDIRMCIACDYTKNRFVNAAKNSVSAGYPIIHLDVHNGGRYSGAICYNKTHRHPLGGGTWVYEELAKIFKQTWSECSAISKDFALSMEQPSELFMPYLTLGQSRYCVSKREFPFVPPISEPVPLLLYLHHDHFFGWVEGRLSRSTVENKYFALAKAFVGGNTPGIPGSEFNMNLPEYSQYKLMYQNLIKGYTGYAKEPLFYGRMMSPIELNVEQIDYKFPPSSSTSSETGVILGPDTLYQSFPKVLNSVWLTPEGRTFLIFINHTKDKQVFTVDLTKTPGWTSDAIVKFSNAGGTKNLTGSSQTIESAPYSMCAIEFTNKIPLTKLWKEENIPTQAYNIRKSTNISKSVFPNPFFESFTVKLPENSKKVDIYNVQGQKLFSQATANVDVLRINELKGHLSGNYFLRLSGKEDCRSIQIIKH